MVASLAVEASLRQNADHSQGGEPTTPSHKCRTCAFDTRVGTRVSKTSDMQEGATSVLLVRDRGHRPKQQKRGAVWRDVLVAGGISSAHGGVRRIGASMNSEHQGGR